MEQSYLSIFTMMIIPTHVRENLSPMGYAILSEAPWQAAADGGFGRRHT